jgi:hypothetical protein
LTRTQDADLIALADSGARIRLVLRNPLDSGAGPRHSMALASVFTSDGGTEATAAQPAAMWNHAIQLHVQALAASPAALGVLDAGLNGGKDALSVDALGGDVDAEQLIRGMEQKQELEIVSSWRLTAGVGRPISFRAGTGKACRLRVQFSPELDSTGKLSLRVKPEVSLQRGHGMETRQYTAGLRDANAFLVSGLVKDQESLYPGHSWGDRQLVILVTSRRR